jgi:hypothetical protein
MLPTGGGGMAMEEPTCAAVSQAATSERRPVDVIVVIDNSPSMAGQIRAVQARINEDLATVMADSGVDYRVIMISSYVDERDVYAVCVGAPLGKTDCSAKPRPPLEDNPPRFYHVDVEVQSSDAWCKLFDSWSAPDDRMRGNGWSHYAREGAFKSFIIISDGGVGCFLNGGDWSDLKYKVDEVAKGVDSTGGHVATVEDATSTAEAFDRDLLALSPAQFGTAERRNYRVHNIISVPDNVPVTAPYGPTDPLFNDNDNVCEPSLAPNLGSQILSNLTGGLRYPVCNSDDYNAIFRAVAKDVEVESRLSCAWAIPAPPAGQKFDRDKINLEYTPDGLAMPQTIFKVAGAAACGPQGGWHYDDELNPTQVVVCPSTCETLKAAKEGQVQVAFGCNTKPVVQ